MEKVKTQDLCGAHLDYWVARAEGRDVEIVDQGENPVSPRYYARLVPTNAVFWPSTHWNQGGPIIEREKLELVLDGNGWGVPEWSYDEVDGHKATGPTPLVAAMRAFVAGKFGDVVDDMMLTK